MKIAERAPQAQAITQAEKVRRARELLRVREDLFYWLENYVYTLDEDDRCIKRFPSQLERPELYELAGLWWNREQIDEQRKLAIDKSRQMMGTWVFVLCDLWDTAFHGAVRTFFQSKKEMDAKALLDRGWFTFQRMPRWMQPTHQKLETQLIFPKIDSLIWAIPQGGDHARSYTISNLFTDEAQKQPEFGDAVDAAIPSTGKKGRIHALGTARGKGNAWYHVRKKPPIVKRLAEYPLLKAAVNARNFTVGFLDFRLNPKYDKDWERKMRATMSEAVWNREYEASYEEAVGVPVLTVDPGIHFQSLKHLDGKPFWRGWDFAYRHPACIVTQMNTKDQWCWLWILVGENETTRKFAHRVFEICDAKFPQGKDDQGRPLGQNWLDFCDPQGTEVSRGTGTSDIQDLCAVYEERYRRFMDITYRKRSFEIGITLIRERLALRNDQQPGLLIHDECEDAKDAAMGGYHFPDDRKSGAKSEYPADDGYYIHPMDAARYIANCKFEPAESRVEVEQGAWPKPWEDIDGPSQELEVMLR